MEQVRDFKIIGISVETNNENGQSAKDLSALWERFYSERIFDKIPNKETEEIYSIYTDYEADYRGKYTSIIGQKVGSLANIPNGLIGREFKGGDYLKFTAKGEMPRAVIETWREIWENDSHLDRRYTTDFEIYGEKSQRGADSEVEIYIAVESGGDEKRERSS